MTSNIQGTRNTRPGEPTVVDPTPVVTPTGVGGVAVYDRNPDGTVNSTLRPSSPLADDRLPAETRASGSIMSWIIGAIVLVILAYFLLQFIF
jgi:hypothetical protein